MSLEWRVLLFAAQGAGALRGVRRLDAVFASCIREEPMATKQEMTLAINGGTPAATTPLPPNFPGGVRIGKEEADAVIEVITTQRLF
jgi:hypothetical protein